MEKKTNEKQPKKKKAKQNKKARIIGGAVVIIIAIAVICVVVLKNRKPKLKEAPSTEIDYSILDIEQDDGNINMSDTEFAEVKDGVKRNNSSKVKEEKTYNSLKIKEAAIEAAGGMSQFMAIAYNEYEKEIEEQNISITFLDQAGNEMATIEANIPHIEPNGDVGIVASTDIDITDAYDYVIKQK